MSYQYARHVWLRNKQRLADPRSIFERRRFRAVREEFYDGLWGEAASAVGARMEKLANGLMQITRNGLVTFLHHSDLMLDSAVAHRVASDKALIYRIMASKGLRIPRRREFDLATLGRAEAFLARAAGPVVVKPADGTAGGCGVTTGITTKEALHAAAWHAAGYHEANPSLLIEEQLTGSSFRLLYRDGVFIDAVRRDPPVVVGDGQSSLRQLVIEENHSRRTCRPISALSPLVIDQECRNTLAAQGLSAGSVPEAGRAVPVKLAVNENGAGQNHVVRDTVHEDIIMAGQRLVRQLGLGLVGLDVTATEISAPLGEGEVIFNEVNTSPGIHHHYLVANPEVGAAIAPDLLEWMFASGRGVVEW